jgi:hypothetical protein
MGTRKGTRNWPLGASKQDFVDAPPGPPLPDRRGPVGLWLLLLHQPPDRTSPVNKNLRYGFGKVSFFSSSHGNSFPLGGVPEY